MTAHVQCAHFQSGHLLGMNIFGYSTSNNSCFVFPARQLHLPDQPGLGLRQLVAATHEKPLQHKLSKCGVGLLGKRPVQLDQQSQVDVLALKLSVVVTDVDSHDGVSLSVRSGKREPKIFHVFHGDTFEKQFEECLNLRLPDVFL